MIKRICKTLLHLENSVCGLNHRCRQVSPSSKNCTKRLFWLYPFTTSRDLWTLITGARSREINRTSVLLVTSCTSLYFAELLCTSLYFLLLHDTSLYFQKYRVMLFSPWARSFFIHSEMLRLKISIKGFLYRIIPHLKQDLRMFYFLLEHSIFSWYTFRCELNLHR